LIVRVRWLFVVLVFGEEVFTAEFAEFGESFNQELLPR
jgi:hypothetical protein